MPRKAGAAPYRFLIVIRWICGRQPMRTGIAAVPTPLEISIQVRFSLIQPFWWLDVTSSIR